MHDWIIRLPRLDVIHCADGAPWWKFLHHLKPYAVLMRALRKLNCVLGGQIIRVPRLFAEDPRNQAAIDVLFKVGNAIEFLSPAGGHQSVYVWLTIVVQGITGSGSGFP
jgi:hypothetical protein